MMFSQFEEAEMRYVYPGCPNAGHACNCIGVCRPILVLKSDTRSDQEIIEAHRQVASTSWVSTYKKSLRDESHIILGEN